MSSNLEAYTNRPASPSAWSRVGRNIARVIDGTELAIVRATGEATVENARLDAIDAVAARGLQGVALVSQLEQQLAQSVPIAATRLQAVGDMHALTTAQEVASFSRRLP